MKKIVACSLVIVLVSMSCRTKFPVTSDRVMITPSEADLENGKNLTFNVCGQCHYDYHIKSFIGEEMRDLPKFMGKVYSANLTDGHVIDAYTDAELFYLIKTGIAKDGRFVPYMIRPTIADKDLKDIIAYLRTDDDPLKRNDSVIGKTRLSFLGKLAGKIGGKPQPYETGKPQPPADPVQQGRYLVDIVGCYHCHSQSILGLNYRNPEDSKGYMAGGMKFNPDGTKIYASNITPDKNTGIGRYTKLNFRDAVREGKTPDGRELRYPMRHFKRLTDDQCDAIFAYIQSLKPVDHTVRGH